jgi:hypothetical protein
MNERVEQLAAQACVVVRFNIHPHTYKQIDDPNGMHARLEFNKEKFAKLLIQEVLAVQEKLIAEGHNAWHLNGPTKKYFGVE